MVVAEKRVADSPHQMHNEYTNSRLNLAALIVSTLTFLFSLQMLYLVNGCFETESLFL